MLYTYGTTYVYTYQSRSQVIRGSPVYDGALYLDYNLIDVVHISNG